MFYWNNATSCYDMGIFSQMFYYMREYGSVLTTCERDGLLSHFAVHFSPIYYSLLPFYCLFPTPATLLVCQAVLVGSGVIPLVLICCLLLGCAPAPELPPATQGPSPAPTEEAITQIPFESRFQKETVIRLSDEGIDVKGPNALFVYTSNDILYYPDMDVYESGNPFGEGTEADKHSQEEADGHTVVNIMAPGRYRVSGKLSAGHARTLIRVPKNQQYAFACEAIKREYSVREMERAVKAFLTPPEVMQAEKQAKAAAKSEELKAFVERMRSVYRTKVSLIGNDKKGRIYIDYYSPEDLYRFEEFLDIIENTLS
jgi:hypothetical protein